jgi:hypothetical protein
MNRFMLLLNAENARLTKGIPLLPAKENHETIN